MSVKSAGIPVTSKAIAAIRSVFYPFIESYERLVKFILYVDYSVLVIAAASLALIIVT